MADPGNRRRDVVDKHEEYKPGDEKKAVPISFGFSKTVSKFKPTSAARESADRAEERDYLTGVEGRELKSTKPVEKPKELIIPLIHKNRWYKGEGASRGGGGPSAQPETEQDAVESQAVKELIEESQRQQERWKNGEKTDLNLAIPLLMQNQAPEGFEDGDRVRVDLRPEPSTEADYDSVPVEAYGMAMLKGMGWKEGEGIGRTFKQDVKPIEHQLRPKGLGLGADRSAIRDLEPSRPPRPPRPGEERPAEEEEFRVLAVGGCVLIESGPHKELYGKVEGLDPDNARVMVKLAIGGKTVTISQHSLRLIGRKEFDKYSKDISRLSKAHKEKEREKQRREGDREGGAPNGQEEGEGRGSDRRTDRWRDGGKERDKETRKRKHQETGEDREKPRPPTSAPSWLQRDLRVRFIDKKFKGGKYYNSKMTVEDVLTPDTCVCRTEEGRLLDDVKQTMLETVVPKSDSDTVMVVLGQHRGQVGRVLQRERDRCRALVQLDRVEHQVFRLDYDSVCHYVGGGGGD
ncbi:G-patch domain and KOW motifs-containing protein [Amia ocellicauda]|uniref:G-patch domain and KOW motifs-containing protein n=1 Tax=Amia ocellicauda TaxID=2972642 RepID=UPI00346482E6